MTYPYKCPNCGDFTVERRMSDDPLKDCPTCQAPVQRIYTPTISIAKCDGFHGKGR